MGNSDRVIFYFDFISPYSYLANALIRRRPDLRSIHFAHRPVVFGSMLAARGATGPGEIPTRRRLGMQDVLLLAEHYGLELRGPPKHPFNSVYALRSVCAVPDETDRGALVERYFRAAWEEGRDLEDLDVLRRCLADVELSQDPEEVASKPEIRAALKQNTRDALGAGAHGVPTFQAGDVLFFGHDRLELLAAYMAGAVRLDRNRLEEMLARPQPPRIT